VARVIGELTRPPSISFLSEQPTDVTARGKDGDEASDYGYTFTNARRRSNSSTQALSDFKTKFETRDEDPVFEEELHGPVHEEPEENLTLDKEESTDSATSTGSIEEETEARRSK
jgi:hypothetical protein